MVEFVDDRRQPPLETDPDLDFAAEPQIVVGDIAEQAADDAGERQADRRYDNRRLLRALRGVVLGIIGERPIATAECYRPHHRRQRVVLPQRAQGDGALIAGDVFVVGVIGVLQHHRKQRAVVIRQHQRRQLVGKRDEARGLGGAFHQNGGRENETDRPVLPQQRDRVRRDRLAGRRCLRQHRPDDRMPVVGTTWKAQRIRTARLDVHLHVDRLVDRLDVQRLIVEIANRRVGEAGALQFRLRRRQFGGLEPRDPVCDHEIGLEGIDGRPQRLQHIGLHHRRRPKQSGCDAREQLALGQPVLHQAGMNVDRARKRDAVDRQFLVVDAIGRETGEQNSDQRDEADNEAQPNHSFTRK